MGASNSLLDVGFSELDLKASICLDSFYEFFCEMWDTVVPEKLVLNWHIKAFCDELQKVAERVFEGKEKNYDLVVNMPPGTSKSMICSVMFPAWIWARMPTARIICASFDKSLVQDLALKCRDVLESEKYKQMFPYVILREDARAKGKYVNTKGGVRYTATVSGQSPMGRHAHFLVVDDPIDPKEAASEEKLKIAKRFMNGILPSRKIDKGVTPTILVMQRLAEDDPSGDWLERRKKGLKHLCFPAELTDWVAPLSFRKHYKKGLLDPIRLSKKVLDEYKEEGEYYYAGQFLQRPVPEGGLMFKVERLNIRVLPHDIKFKRMVRYWDKAYTDGGGAYSVGVLMGVEMRGKQQHFWVLDVVRGQWSSDDRERRIRMTAEMDEAEWGEDVVTQWVEQEPSAGKESAAGTVRTLAGYRVRTDVRGGASDGNKIMRADPFSAQVNIGNVTLVKADWNAAYIRELEHFPHSRFKDQVDGSSGAFNKIARRRKRVGAFGRSAA